MKKLLRNFQQHNFSPTVLFKCFIHISRVYFLVWSREGCNTLPGKFAGTVKCECTHLTNFALMLDVDQSGSDPLSLKIITWIGCGISLLGLVITILTYSVFRCVFLGMLSCFGDIYSSLNILHNILFDVSNIIHIYFLHNMYFLSLMRSLYQNFWSYHGNPDEKFAIL